MNGNDSRFSYGLSKGKDSISTWILPENIANQVKQELQITIAASEQSTQETVKAPSTQEEQLAHETAKEQSTQETIKDQSTQETMKQQSTQETMKEPSTQDTAKETQAISEALAGEKRKRQESIIPNTFKKHKSEHSSCQNGKKIKIKIKNRMNTSKEIGY